MTMLTPRVSQAYAEPWVAHKPNYTTPSGVTTHDYVDAIGSAQKHVIPR
jgi:hypothetical protein